ncbi:MAG TPA: tetratricopeptide repeat protein [Thermoanaerobaculia bacterium]|nr:tetratricopeptide repeat protein [Thermoanaerobaculia bacterium]
MAVQRDKVIASAEKLVAKGKIEPAIKEYERLLEDNPNDVNTLNRIGDLWVRINRNDEAVKVFSKIAEHYSKDGFFLKAIAIYKKINKLDPSKLDIYARLADLYAKQGLAMEAKSQYQVLADFYLKHGEPGNALGIYKKISELDPNSINVHVKLADLYSQNNQTAEALKEYDRVGRMLLKRGMLDEAVQVFRKALKIDPKNTDLVDSLVTALLEAKDFANAQQIVEAALEQNANHPRLLAMLGKIQLGKGDANGARTTLERALASDPNENSVRDALAELYLRQNNADKALEMIAPIVEKALGRGERHVAIEMLNRILRIDAGHAPTLERLVALYTRLNEETNVLASMNSLAEAHMGRGRYEEAAKVLERLIAKEPQNSQHRTKLQFVRTQMGGNETLPPRTRSLDAPLPPMEIEEPTPSFDVAEEVDDSISLDLDASPPLELDFSLDVPPAPPQRTPPPAPVERTQPQPPPPMQALRPAVELAAESDESGDDLDFITEHLTEAEVFAKYGLAEKAAEHLRAVLERAPKNVTAHERLFRILLEEGDVAAATTAAQAYVAVLDASGDTATIDAVRGEFVTRGHAFEPRTGAKTGPVRAQTTERPMPAAAPAPPPVAPISLDDITAPSDELSFDLDAASPEIEFDIEEPEPVIETASEEVVAEAPIEMLDEAIELAPEEELELAPSPLELEEDAELLTDFSSEPAPEFANEFASTAGTSTFEDALSFDEPAPAIEFEPEPEPVAAAPSEEVFFGGDEFGGMDLEQLPLEEVGEIDFYIEQELFDEARGKLEALQARFPGNHDLELRRDRIEAAATATAAAQAASAPRPPLLSRDEIESELLSAIPDEDEDDFVAPAPVIPAPPAAAAPAPPMAVTAALVQEENLFADEDNFFDLAAELESELAEDEEPISLSEEEQSLEEIFKEFKKGVEQQLDSEDYDTHYNLGIAYKEMGLIDEAIGEFQLASKDPKRAVECASMLGLCFLEKGMPQLAIKWYRKGLEMPEITEEEHIGLLYDLGSAYQEVGDTDAAQKAFMEVYGMNSNYRDIVTRIKALEDSRR